MNIDETFIGSSLDRIFAGPALDVLVIEIVLGKTPCHDYEEFRSGPVQGWTRTNKCQHEVDCCYPSGRAPQFSTNIAAAWSLFNSLPEGSWIERPHRKKKWVVGFLRRDAKGFSAVTAPTVTLAICRAVLLYNRTQ